jgi:hypothetical protein
MILYDLSLVVVDPQYGPHTNVQAAYRAAIGYGPGYAVWIPSNYKGTDAVPANPTVPVFDLRGTGVFYGGAAAYDIAAYVPDVYTSSQVLLRIPLARVVTFPVALAGSVAVLETAATASTVFSVQKNGVEFGTITFGVSGSVGTFASASGASFAIGDILSVLAPASADMTAAGLGFTLVGTRS